MTDVTKATKDPLVVKARSGNYHKADCNEDERIKDYCECTDAFIARLADHYERLLEELAYVDAMDEREAHGEFDD